MSYLLSCDGQLIITHHGGRSGHIAYAITRNESQLVCQGLRIGEGKLSNNNAFVTDSIEKALDCAIRDYETKGDIEQYGYKIENKIYENYMSNKTWKSFKEDMRKNYRDEFEKGGGKELEERKTRYGSYPPKMACYGSSSRLTIYTRRILKTFPLSENCQQ